MNLKKLCSVIDSNLSCSILQHIKPEVDDWIKQNALPLYTKYDLSQNTLQIRFKKSDLEYYDENHYWLILRQFDKIYFWVNGYCSEHLFKSSEVVSCLDKQLEAYRSITNIM